MGGSQAKCERDYVKCIKSLAGFYELSLKLIGDYIKHLESFRVAQQA